MAMCFHFTDILAAFYPSRESYWSNNGCYPHGSVEWPRRGVQLRYWRGGSRSITLFICKSLRAYVKWYSGECDSRRFSSCTPLSGENSSITDAFHFSVVNYHWMRLITYSWLGKFWYLAPLGDVRWESGWALKPVSSVSTWNLPSDICMALEGGGGGIWGHSILMRVACLFPRNTQS